MNRYFKGFIVAATLTFLFNILFIIYKSITLGYLPCSNFHGGGGPCRDIADSFSNIILTTVFFEIFVGFWIFLGISALIFIYQMYEYFKNKKEV